MTFSWWRGNVGISHWRRCKDDVYGWTEPLSTESMRVREGEIRAWAGETCRDTPWGSKPLERGGAKGPGSAYKFSLWKWESPFSYVENCCCCPLGNWVDELVWGCFKLVRVEGWERGRKFGAQPPLALIRSSESSLCVEGAFSQLEPWTSRWFSYPVPPWPHFSTAIKHDSL